jgi:hypothetical protein
VACGFQIPAYKLRKYLPSLERNMRCMETRTLLSGLYSGAFKTVSAVLRLEKVNAAIQSINLVFIVQHTHKCGNYEYCITKKPLN